MNGIDDIMLYDKTCPFCDGSGEPDEYDEFEDNELGYCQACNGTGIEQKEERIIEFKCECGYTEYEDEEGLGYCPFCK